MLKQVVLVLAAVWILVLPVIPSEAGVIGMWLFDEGTGKVAEDLSPTGNNGVVADGVKWVEGKFGSAVEVNGPGEDVVIPMLDIYNQEDFTFECWVYPFGVMPQQYDQIIITGRGEWGADAPGAFQLGITIANDVPSARWFFWVGQWATVSDGPEIKENNWYHFAGTLEGGQKATLYVNGEEVAQSDLPAKLADNPHPIYVGSWGAAEDPLSAYHGYIDELRYSDEVLVPEELGFFGSFSPVEPEGKLASTWAGIKCSVHGQ